MKNIARYVVISGLLLTIGQISAASKKEKVDEKKVANNAPTSFPKMSKEEAEKGCKISWPNGPKKEVENCVKYIMENMKK